MRPVNRDEPPLDSTGDSLAFQHYADARDHLVGRIGDYCSYCEVCLHSRMDVEHIEPKSHQPARERDWNNLLLACPNCNSIKGDTDVDLDEYFWPDRDNTARAFQYDGDAPPRIVQRLSKDLQRKARRTLELTGLDRVPGHPRYSNRDQRWKKRREAYGIALRLHRNLGVQDTHEMREVILLAAIKSGFWSVWMEVFHDDVQMRLALIGGFQGTATDCFDQNADLVPRPGGQV